MQVMQEPDCHSIWDDKKRTATTLFTFKGSIPDGAGWDEQRGHAPLCWIFMTNLGQQCAMPSDLMHLHGAHTYIICILALHALHMPAHRATVYVFKL